MRTEEEIRKMLKTANHRIDTEHGSITIANAWGWRLALIWVLGE